MSNTLICYFSASGKTKNAAYRINEYINADIYEIKPKKLYTVADLNWNDKFSRTTLEGKDWNIRPEIANDINIEQYPKIYLGFPIWWYRAPNIINTFLESHDLTSKTIVLFATSGGSSFEETKKYLLPSVSLNTKVIEGIVFKNSINEYDIKKFIEKGM